jgi:hypothetical protein
MLMSRRRGLLSLNGTKGVENLVLDSNLGPHSIFINFLLPFCFILTCAGETRGLKLSAHLPASPLPQQDLRLLRTLLEVPL